MDINALLKQKYGQNRFNPAAGQTQMTFEEWMDRHPALQGRADDVGGAQMNQMAYNTAIKTPYTGAQNPVAPEAAVSSPGQVALPGGPDTPPKGLTAIGGALNKPKKQKASVNAATRRQAKKPTNKALQSPVKKEH